MDIEYIDRFEKKIQEELLRLCTNYKMLDGVLLSTEDIDNLWELLAPDYVADAVQLIKDYPSVSLAWAAYLGMAIAHGWDFDWAACANTEYTAYYGERGFDDMDEHIVQSILNLKLDSDKAKELENMIRRCAQVAETLIRHEQIEPQSVTAFHIFVRASKAMYRTGAAMELKRLGYRFNKIG